MNGKHRTLLTWLGKSLRPVAMIASGATSRASVGQDLGRGVGQREDDRPLGHARDHVGLQDIGAGQAEEQVRALDHLVQRARVAGPAQRRLLRVMSSVAALVDQAVNIAEPDVLALYAEFQQHVEAGDPRRAAAGGDDLDVLESLARDPQRVGRRRPHDDGGAVLVVVEDGDVHPLAADSFDDEAIGRLDVFEVDRAEGGSSAQTISASFSGSGSSTSMSKQSILANFLKRTALPSITGLEASAPILPSPSTAEPLETTATRLPRAV
jgi:hypothetical protein